MPYKVKKIHAHEILDSRGDPTVNVSVLLGGGVIGVASVPSGASTGSHEALELRDGDKKRYKGKGVQKACLNVNKQIFKALVGQDVRKQKKIDQIMIELDGTVNKSQLGANAILGVSLAVAHAASKASKTPLYAYLRKAFNLKLSGYKLPVPLMNFVNGGLHADTDLDLQEIMVVPYGIKKFHEQVRAGSEIFHTLGNLLKENKLDTDLGNEGGYAPRFGGTEKALGYVLSAIKKAGYKPGKEVKIGLDIAATELFDEKSGKYIWKEDKLELTREKSFSRYASWFKKYFLYSIEDPFAEDDWGAWQKFTKKYKSKGLIIGDDLFVTNIDRLRNGVERGAGNAILIKPNQVGSLSETIDTIMLAKKKGYKVIVSHRSGETSDTTIADLAVSVNADGIKTGSVARSERVAKYNRLMEIEEEIK